jgi:hypothetical protein
MTERFDHRDATARGADTTEDQVIDSPVQDGAEEMREETQLADEKGEAEDGQDAPG